MAASNDGDQDTEFDVSLDEPSETEKLEVKCLRLENKIKTLKDVSAIRKNLLELREREAKDLVKKLQYFEGVFDIEKESRQKLSTRMKEADIEYEKLSQKLSENVIALNETKRQYEQRLRLLSFQFDEAAESLDRVVSTKDELEKRLIDECTSYKSQLTQMESKLGELEELKEDNIEKIKKLEIIQFEKNELNHKFKIVEKENNDLKKEIQEIKTRQNETISEHVEVELEKICELKKKLKESLEANESLSYQMSLLNSISNENDGKSIDFERISDIGVDTHQTEDISNGRDNMDEIDQINSNVLDVSGFMEKLEESERNPCSEIPGQESCYKSVDTTEGPILVLSVSRTFIKLKDLILEKTSLQKEIESLKQLNTKLESKVDTQSRRLYHVSLELNKTWKLVKKLKAQHGQLHTSKAVMRYELQEKRRLLEKLKKDLCLSRENCMKVHQKNSESQIEWESIRDEFSRRRAEVCQSRESAFFEESSSATSIENDDEKGETPQVFSRDDILEVAYLERRPSSHELEDAVDDDDDDGEHSVALDGFVVDLAAEIVSIETEVLEGTDDQVSTVDEEDSSNITYEELINRRAHRLRELEEQCRLLYSKLKTSSARNTELANKLATLHNQYGSENSPDDSVMEGDEIGLLSEISGDTTYVLRNTQEPLNQDGANTEILLENEDEEIEGVNLDLVEQLQYEGMPTLDIEFSHLPLQLQNPSSAPGIFQFQNVQSHHGHNEGLGNNVGHQSQSNSNLMSSSSAQVSPSQRRSSAPIPTHSSGNIAELIRETNGKNENSRSRRGGSREALLAELRRTFEDVVIVDGDEDEGEGDGEVVAMTSLASLQLQPHSAPRCDAEVVVDEFPKTIPSIEYEDCNREEEGSSPSANPSDLTMMSRLILQQLPKILNVFKKENLNLKMQAAETRTEMNEMQLELEEQKDLLKFLRPQIETSLKTEMELRGEVDLKQRLIQELTTKIQIATDHYETINKEHGQMAEYFAMKLQETKIQEQRKLVKMRNMKTCTKCTKKFTLFKRRVHCGTCGHSFCGECLVEQGDTFSSTTNLRRTNKKILICNTCNERKRKLDAVVEKSLNKIQL